MTWAAVSPRPTTNGLWRFSARGNLLLASGARGAILASTDGVNWARIATPTTNFLSGLETFPGGFVASGDNGALLTSANRTNWNSINTSATNWFYSVRWLNGLLLAVGENGALRTGTNATTWTARTSGASEWLTDAAFVDGAWFVVGTGGAVLASTNLTTWTNIGTLTWKSLFGVAATASQLVTVGVEGLILRAQVAPDLTPVSFVSYTRSADRNVFLLGGKPDQRIQMLRSTTLTNWTPELNSNSLTALARGCHWRTRLPPCRPSFTAPYLLRSQGDDHQAMRSSGQVCPRTTFDFGLGTRLCLVRPACSWILPYGQRSRQHCWKVRLVPRALNRPRTS